MSIIAARTRVKSDKHPLLAEKNLRFPHHDMRLIFTKSEKNVKKKRNNRGNNVKSSRIKDMIFSTIREYGIKYENKLETKVSRR